MRAVLLAVLCVMLSGCAWFVPQTKVSAAKAQWEKAQTEMTAAGDKKATYERAESAGPAMQSPNADKLTVPTADAGAGGAGIGKGGGGSFYRAATSTAGLFVVAGLLMAGGIAAAWLTGSLMLALAGVGAGVCLIIATQIAEAVGQILVIGAIVLGVAFVAYMVYELWKGKTVGEALKAVAGGVQVLPSQVQTQVKAAVASMGGKAPAVDAAIEKAKKDPAVVAATAAAQAAQAANGGAAT